MKRFEQILIACVAAVLVAAGGFSSSAAPPPAVEAANPWLARGPVELIELDGKVVQVVDGDTLDVRVPIGLQLLGRDASGKIVPATDGLVPLVIRVRLLADTNGRGCWAPEVHTTDPGEKRKGLAASKHLEGLCLGRKVKVIVPAKGYELKDYMSLERVLAVVKAQGKSVGEEQIKAKHASSTKGGVLGK